MTINGRITVLAVFLLYTLPFLAHAQDATIQCDTPQQKIACQAALDQANAEYAQAQKDLTAAQAQSSSISNDIAVLNARIKAAQLQIKAKNLLIQTLGNTIAQKQTHIDDLETRIDSGKATLSTILRKTNEVGDFSLPEIILSQSSLTGFFTDVDTFASIQDSLKHVFNQLRSDQASTSVEKSALEVRQNTEQDARYVIQQQQKNIEADQAQKKQLLAISKGNEKSYATLAAQKATQAAKIRAALFPLAGAKAIAFGDAVNYANIVYQKLGVPADFLLAILKQETNIGGNVGTCYLTNTSDGSGINTKTNQYIAKVMKPGRDIQPFLDIVSSLGYDYKTTTVSCPQSIGYGGGMGPAQFIASTWMLFKDRIANALGVSVPNPWKPLDSFMAAGIYLADLGANSSSYSAQKNAACKYYSGSSCRSSNGSSGYGSSVMSLADSIQRDINLLQ
ncbi:MAG: hypothetical protein WCG07_02830 [Candidatus Taylorbacteria bacterium]